jgi:hypothetical protein
MVNKRSPGVCEHLHAPAPKDAVANRQVRFGNDLIRFMDSDFGG